MRGGGGGSTYGGGGEYLAHAEDVHWLVQYNVREPIAGAEIV